MGGRDGFFGGVEWRSGTIKGGIEGVGAGKAGVLVRNVQVVGCGPWFRGLCGFKGATARLRFVGAGLRLWPAGPPAGATTHLFLVGVSAGRARRDLPRLGTDKKSSHISPLKRGKVSLGRETFLKFFKNLQFIHI